ncbi:hypothetical protein FI667_g14610, partial [Globisporangium splendens]
MSFWGDDDALEAALAFLDACDGGGSVPTSDGNCEWPTTTDERGDNSPLLGSLQVVIRASRNRQLVARCNQSLVTNTSRAALNLAKRKVCDKTATAVATVNQARARKTAEAVALRDEIATLLAEVAALQHGPCAESLLRVRRLERLLEKEKSASVLTAQEKQVSVWLERAAEQARERYKSEMLNITLKNAIKKQHEIHQSLKHIVSERTSGFHSNHDSKLLCNDAMTTNESVAVAELQACVTQMAREIDLTLQTSHTENGTSVTCAMEVKEHPLSGQYIEVRSTAPLKCGFQEADQMNWRLLVEANKTLVSDRHYMKPDRNRIHLEHFKRCEFTDNSFEKSYKLILDGASGPVELHGVTLLRKYEEPHRSVYVWTSRIDSSKDGLTFREKGWIVFSCSSGGDKTQSPTAFQSCYQLFSDPPSGGPGGSCGPEADLLRESLMRSRSYKMQTATLQAQNMMLTKFSAFQLQKARS